MVVEVVEAALIEDEVEIEEVEVDEAVVPWAAVEVLESTSSTLRRSTSSTRS